MLGQLRKAIKKSYVRGRTPNLNRLSSVRENTINSHPQPSSVFAQFPVVYMFNWMLGQLREAVEKSFLKRRSYIRGKTSNLNRLSRARKERSRPQPNSVFAQFSVVCMFNWMLGQLRKGCGKVVSCGEVVCSWKSSEFENVRVILI